MKTKQIYTIIGLSIGLIGSLLLAFSLDIQDALPLNESSVQLDMTTKNDAIIDRAEISFVTIKRGIFYPGIIALISSFILQLIGCWSAESRKK